MTKYDESKTYIQYCNDILNKKIPSSKHLYLACERFKSWFNRDDLFFDYKDVDKRIRIVSKLKHSTGKCAHQSFILLPYQQWIFAGIFGFKYNDTKLRVTKNVLLFMARKQGTTCLAAALSIVQLLLDGEDGQEIDFIANSGKQAKIGFDMTHNFAESIDSNGVLFKRYRDSIKMPITKSIIQVLNSDSMTLDGLSASTFIEDELHAAKTWDLHNVLKSSQGYRQQPLAIVISTAGYLLDSYPLYEMRKTCIQILKNEKVDDSQFTALYELDEDDDWANDETCWVKANPSIGHTVTYEYLRDQVRSALNQTSLEFGVKTKQFNLFCQSSDTWIPNDVISSCMQPINLEDFKDEQSFVGVDLSAVSDLTSTTVMLAPNPNRKLYPDKFIFKTHIYVPASCLDDNVNKSLYFKWQKQKQITITDGNVVDYDYILHDQLYDNSITPFIVIAYDAYNATQYAINATNNGLNMQPYSQSLGNFNKPTKLFEMLVKSGKVIIDTNECVRWCFNNVKLRIDYNDNCKPDKPTREAKIDAVISMVEALGAYLDEGGGVDVSVL